MKNAVLLLTLGVPSAALAHPGHGIDGFAAALAHPFGGLDHLLAFLLVGWWAAKTGGARWFALPLGFAAATAAGAVTALGGLVVPGVEFAIAASLVVFGLLVAHREQPLGRYASAALVAFGAAHGQAHGLEFGQHGAAVAPLAGLALSTLLLHAGGAFALKSLRPAGAAIGCGAAGYGALLLAQLL